MRTIYVGNLAPEAQEEQVQELFSQHGRVRSIKLARDVFSGNCRGFGFIQMEGHEARAAIAALNGKTFLGRPLKVNEEKAKAGGRGRR